MCTLKLSFGFKLLAKRISCFVDNPGISLKGTFSSAMTESFCKCFPEWCKSIRQMDFSCNSEAETLSKKNSSLNKASLVLFTIRDSCFWIFPGIKKSRMKVFNSISGRNWPPRFSALLIVTLKRFRTGKYWTENRKTPTVKIPKIQPQCQKIFFLFQNFWIFSKIFHKYTVVIK